METGLLVICFVCLFVHFVNAILCHFPWNVAVILERVDDSWYPWCVLCTVTFHKHLFGSNLMCELFHNVNAHSRFVERGRRRPNKWDMTLESWHIQDSGKKTFLKIYRRPFPKKKTTPPNGVGERFLSFMLIKICIFFSNFRYGSDIRPRPASVKKRPLKWRNIFFKVLGWRHNDSCFDISGAIT